ncbi:MAG TPA: hypothetical protein ENN99_07630 [Chloroflexi bacterium]|nr:hypothetical protein [Chloroflexota bacterium]
MTKQTGTIITIVVAVITLCCSGACCASGIASFASGGQYIYELDTYVEPYFAIVPCCLSILFWILPLLSWLLLVRGKEDAVTDYSSVYGTEEYVEGTIE